MIQLKKSGSVLDFGDIERLNAKFAETQCILLPTLVEPCLLDFLLRRMEAGQWRVKVHEGIGTEVILDDPPAVHLLHFLANTPAFLSAVHQITGCTLPTWFGGRVYRFSPNSGHYDSWHDDFQDGRLIGMSLNLSPRGYSGGIFQLRERKSKSMLTEVANTGWGDATLFRISRELQHQVTDVTGDEPKTAFAGWFQSGPPTLQQYLRSQLPH